MLLLLVKGVFLWVVRLSFAINLMTIPMLRVSRQDNIIVKREVTLGSLTLSWIRVRH